jgi:hypothetical protein
MRADVRHLSEGANNEFQAFREKSNSEFIETKKKSIEIKERNKQHLIQQLVCGGQFIVSEKLKEYAKSASLWPSDAGVVASGRVFYRERSESMRLVGSSLEKTIYEAAYVGLPITAITQSVADLMARSLVLEADFARFVQRQTQKVVGLSETLAHKLHDSSQKIGNETKHKLAQEMRRVASVARLAAEEWRKVDQPTAADAFAALEIKLNKLANDTEGGVAQKQIAA